jgi:hypothetical protein
MSEQKKRVYDKWGGNPKGIPEDPTRCIEEVVDWSGWHYFQCSRKRGYGPNGEYCKQHAKKIEKRKQWEEEFKKRYP